MHKSWGIDHRWWREKWSVLLGPGSQQHQSGWLAFPLCFHSSFSLLQWLAITPWIEIHCQRWISLGTELQNKLRSGRDTSLLSSWRGPNTEWFCRESDHQFAIPYRASPFPTLSSYWKHCFSKLGVLEERGRGAWSRSLLPGHHLGFSIDRVADSYLPTRTGWDRTRASLDGGQAHLLPAWDAPALDLLFLFIGLFFNASLICKEIK